MHRRLPTLGEAAPAGVVPRGEIKLRVPHGRGARRWRGPEAAGELHFWGFTLQVRSGSSRPCPCSQDTGHQGINHGSWKFQGLRPTPQGGSASAEGTSTESPLKHLPNLSSACSHSPRSVLKDEPPTLMDQPDLPGLFPPAQGGFSDQAGSCRTQLQTLQVITAGHLGLMALCAACLDCWRALGWALQSTAPFIESQFRTSGQLEISLII